MRRGFVVGFLSVTLSLGAGCATWPRYEYVSWSGRDVQVTDAEPGPTAPCVPLGRPLAADTEGRDHPLLDAVAYVVVAAIAIAFVVGYQD